MEGCRKIFNEPNNNNFLNGLIQWTNESLQTDESSTRHGQCSGSSKKNNKQTTHDMSHVGSLVLSFCFKKEMDYHCYIYL